MERRKKKKVEKTNPIIRSKNKPNTDKEEGPIVQPPPEISVFKLPIVSGWRNPRKNIGCCPPGDQRGTPFRAGMACCHNQVYNATTQICCVSKQMWVCSNIHSFYSFIYFLFSIIIK